MGDLIKFPKDQNKTLTGIIRSETIQVTPHQLKMSKLFVMWWFQSEHVQMCVRPGKIPTIIVVPYCGSKFTGYTTFSRFRMWWLKTFTRRQPEGVQKTFRFDAALEIFSKKLECCINVSRNVPEDLIIQKWGKE